MTTAPTPALDVPPRRWVALWLQGQLRAFWPPLVAALLGLGVLLVLYQVRAAQFEREQHERVAAELAEARNGLAVASMASFGPVLSMASLIAIDRGLTPTRFDELARRFFAPAPSLSSVAVAPDDLVTMVYPSKSDGGEAGERDITALNARSALLRELHLQGQAGVLAPVRLGDGRVAAVLYAPVNVQDDADREGRYWGLVSGIVEIAPLLHQAGFDALSHDVELALFQARANGLPGTPIMGDAQIAARGPLATLVEVPGTRWVLAAVPRGGWSTLPPWGSPDLVAVGVGALALTLLTFVLAQQRHRQRARNAALAEELSRSTRMQAELERSQARVTSVAALGSDWIWEQDAELRFTYIGGVQSLPEQLNFKGVMGRRRWDMLGASGAEWDAHRAAVERHEAFRDFEYSFISSAGRRQVTVSGVPLFDSEGRFTGYRGIGRDVTVERQHAIALRESRTELMNANNRLQAILDAAVEVAIIATDLQGRVTLFNAGAQRLLRYGPVEMIGRSPTILHLHGELEQRATQLQQTLGRSVRGFEVLTALPERDGLETRVWTLMRRDGYPLAASLTVTRVRSHEGEPIGWLAVARDITAQMQAESQLRDLNTLLETRVSLRTAELNAARDHLQQTQDELLRAERMAALGSLVAGVAHELNTPLGNALITATTLGARAREFRAQVQEGPLRRSALDSHLQEVAQATMILQRSLQSASHLVEHFKQVSADQTSMRRRRFDLGAIVNDALTVLQPRLRNAPFRIESDIALTRELDSFPGPLEQIVSNLLQNAALHAFPAGHSGCVRLRARELDANHFEFVVEDDGIGMQASVCARAFEPFFTTKLGSGGTGLGLNIVLTLCRDTLGGSVELESAPGSGTHFVFRLPYVAPQPQERTTPSGALQDGVA